MNSFPAAVANLRYASFIFWSLSLVLACWVGGTLFFEVRAGMPVTHEEWVHRLMGWFVNAVLIRTFVRGFRRHYVAVRGVA